MDRLGLVVTTALTLEYCSPNRLLEQRHPALAVFLVPACALWVLVVMLGTQPVTSDPALAEPADWCLTMQAGQFVVRRVEG